MNNYKVTNISGQISTSENYTFWIEPYKAHVDMTINEETGYIKIDSCYGQYQFSWPSFKNRGSVSLKRFLFTRSDWHYVMNKFSYGRRREFKVFEARETVESFKKKVIDLRVERQISEECARDMWDSLESLEDIESLDIFINQFMEDNKLSEWFCEPWEQCITGYTHHQKFMRDHILPVIAKWMNENVDLDLNCKQAQKSPTNEEKIKEFLTKISSQDNRCTAAPYFYVIRTKVKRLAAQGCGDYIEYFHPGDPEVTYQSEEEYIQDQRESEEYELMSDEEQEEFDERMELIDIELESAEYVDDWEEKGMFLTESDAKAHLERNSYHYSEDAHTYVKHAWRAPELKEFFVAMFNYFDISKGNLDLHEIKKEGK